MTLLIPDFSAARVLVAGDVMLDRYLFGTTGRISPEAPVPVVHIHDTDDRPGGAANVAVNLASRGAGTPLRGWVGEDEAGNTLAGISAPHRRRVGFTRTSGQRTITKTRVQSRGQQLIRLDQEEIAAGKGASLASSLQSNIDGQDVVVLSDYGKGALRDVVSLIAECRQEEIPVLVDPKGKDFDKYRGATVLTPNQSEFEAVAGLCATDGILVERAATMIDRLDLGALLITRSDKGMLLVEAGQEPVFLSTQVREVYDVTGAGDTVIAAIAAVLAAGGSLHSAAGIANLAASLVVRKIGVATVTPSELQIALHQRGQGGRGLVAEADLLPMLAEARGRAERIVMTNGCFDILHVGHVSYLEEAKGLGDRLVVAVNDDDSVRRLKGAKRPLNTLADRMSVLAGLAAVDWVVAFSEDTPERLIAALVPDVLVKGGDYKVEEIAGAKKVLSNGGEVRILSLRDGHSSSRLIEELSS